MGISSRLPRLERLRRRVGGRDIIVLLQGPSLKGLEAVRERLRPLDVRLATVNKFELVVERR